MLVDTSGCDRSVRSRTAFWRSEFRHLERDYFSTSQSYESLEDPPLHGPFVLIFLGGTISNHSRSEGAQIPFLDPVMLSARSWKLSY